MKIDPTQYKGLPAILPAYAQPKSGALASAIARNDAQKRLARRLGAFVYSLNRAIYWRGISLNGLESRAVRSHARKCMHESSLRAAFWRNLLIEDAGRD